VNDWKFKSYMNEQRSVLAMREVVMHCIISLISFLMSARWYYGVVPMPSFMGIVGLLVLILVAEVLVLVLVLVASVLQHP